MIFHSDLGGGSSDAIKAGTAVSCPASFWIAWPLSPGAVPRRDGSPDDRQKSVRTITGTPKVVVASRRGSS